MDKIKRKKGGVLSWVILILFLSWNTLWISLWSHNNFNFNIDSALPILMVTVLIGVQLVKVITTSEVLNTLKYQIYSVQIWDKNLSKYRTEYGFFRITLMANFIFTFRLKNTIKTTSKEELIKARIKYDDNISKFHKEIGKISYSKEDIMKMITTEIKEIITKRKIILNTKVKDIVFDDVIFVESEIDKILNNGK